MAFIACRKNTLHNDLVGAPIPDPEDRCSKEDAGPRKARIGSRLDHVEIAGGHHGAEMFEPSDAMQTNHRKRDRTGDQDEGLNGIGINDGSKTSCDRVNAGRDHEDDRGLHQRPAGDALQHHASRVQLHGNLREDVSNDRNGREVYGALPVEPALQKFRHGEHIRTQIKGYEHPSQDQEHDAGQPFKMTDRESGRGARAGQANEVLRRDIRYK